MGNYGELSYGYVMNAIINGVKAEKERLYQYELPIAQQTALLANQNRDTKRKPEPYKFSDFSFFKHAEDGDKPSSYYGSAALAMIKEKRFPSWALFCFKELSEIADHSYVPAVTGFLCEDALLLHPVKTNNGYKGLLIAKESAGDQMRDFVDNKGKKVSLFVPLIKAKISAEEDVILYPQAKSP